MKRRKKNKMNNISFEEFRSMLLYHRIVEWNSNKIVLDNGVTIFIRETEQDCCAHAENPSMKDTGILSSLDPVALDKACIDLIYNSKDPGKNHLIERIESRNGTHTIYEANKRGIGSLEYELIEIQKYISFFDIIQLVMFMYKEMIKKICNRG